MRRIREKNSKRLRASFRGLLPAILTFTILVITIISLSVILGQPDSLVESVGSLGVLLLVLVALTVVALAFAAKIDRRPMRTYGLEISETWIRDLLAGLGISVVGSLLLFGYIEQRELASISVELSGFGVNGGLLAVSIVFVGLFGYLIANSIYEEVVFRGIMLSNFVEGLVRRGLSPKLAVILAVVGSSLVFGLFHVPLGVNPVRDTTTSALMAIAFTLAYLVTGSLGLPIGVHIGGLLVESTEQASIMGVELPTIFVLEANAPISYEVFVVRILILSLLIVGWVRLADGNVRIHETIYQPTSIRRKRDLEPI